MAELRTQEGSAARALEFTILNASRTDEVLAATWDEIDLAEKLWVIPAERMKGKREHRVPLSAAGVALLEALAGNGAEGFVFAGRKPGTRLSSMAMLMLLRRMDRLDITVHGFRSTFRDWAAERTSYPREVAEMALAHAIGDKVEAAYRRGELLDKRRRLMAEWARFCAQPAKGQGSVVAMRKR